MLDRAFRLSSNWSYFSEECDWLKIVFSRLDYPDKLVNSTLTRFIADKASDQPTSRLPAATNMQDPVRLVLPFKDQASADIISRHAFPIHHNKPFHTVFWLEWILQKMVRHFVTHKQVQADKRHPI